MVRIESTIGGKFSTQKPIFSPTYFLITLLCIQECCESNAYKGASWGRGDRQSARANHDANHIEKLLYQPWLGLRPPKPEARAIRWRSSKTAQRTDWRRQPTIRWHWSQMSRLATQYKVRTGNLPARFAMSQEHSHSPRQRTLPQKRRRPMDLT